MSDSQDGNEPPHRAVWLNSTEFKQDMKMCTKGRLDHRLRHSSNIRYAEEYYKQPVRKEWARLGLLFWLPVVLHVIGACTSDIFLKGVQQRDVAGLTFILLGMLVTYFSLWYQWEDRYRPCLRAKIFHSIGSLVAAGLNAVLAAYNLGTAKGKLGSDPRVAVSVMAMAIVGLFAPAGSLRLLLKGVAGNLDKTTWADYLDLVWGNNLGGSIAWESLPDGERAWAQSKREEYLVRICRELRGIAYTPTPAFPHPIPSPLPPPSPLALPSPLAPAPVPAPPVSGSSSASSKSSGGVAPRRSSRRRKQTEFYGRSSPGPVAKMTLNKNCTGGGVDSCLHHNLIFSTFDQYIPT
ncbi:hypothetical protein EMCG_05728 [[Emmonsia] crescens]|uniref:Uncharacterized protein n=1 Tax=[Emmonsia] crescens TaxID=73230 RepID=A0A0G2IDQ0_9EURO|nr:hypothetical protein EMCG_05728 [Emmonsia crescens UAMH 3008]